MLAVMHRVLVAVKASVTHTSADCVYSQKLTETQQASMRKQEQIAAQQQQQIKLQAEALENARIQQEITAKQVLKNMHSIQEIITCRVVKYFYLLNCSMFIFY